MKYNNFFKTLLATFLIASTTKAAIGFISQVTGDVTINGLKAKSGDKVDINSTVATKKDGSLQIMIGEAMVAVVGYNSNVKIESYKNLKSKMKVTNKEIQNEKLLLNLQSGSLRMLVAKNENAIRMATVRSGDAFGIVQEGEAHFSAENNTNGQVK